MHCISGVAYSVDTKATHRKAVVYYATHSSRGNLKKNLMPRILHFCVQLYCCSSKHNNNKALRISSTDITLRNREYLQYGLSNGKHR